MNIDWTPVITALVGLIAIIFTTFIPLGIKLFFEAWQARIEKAKSLSEQYQLISDGVVMLVQQTMNTLTNSEKYVAALEKLSIKLNLPPETIRELIENSVATFKLAWGEEWNKIGGKKETPPTDTLPPTV